MNIEKTIASCVQSAIKELFDIETGADKIHLSPTRKEFEGDFTLVVFPFVKMAKKSPEQTAQLIGEFVQKEIDLIESFNVIKGFLNFSLQQSWWLHFIESALNEENYGQGVSDDAAPVVIEYSSPNTNKPLHLGHIRNNLLGYSLAQIIAFSGKDVKKVNLVNDRGIHICKSMLAWMKWGGNETPESSGKKGDKLVGNYYVRFETELKKEATALMEMHQLKEDVARNDAPLMQEARELLRKWEARDPETFEIWKMMNGWVYKGFDETYQRLGVHFDKVYYESDTYLLGKETVLKGLEKKVFYQKEDHSVWADLTQEGLDEKLLLRADGTSVYMTQDIGTAQLRYDDYKASSMIYVVGNEQNYHFDVLKRVLKKMEMPYSDSLFHLSYGMVELPQGKMKSREGTVVDADDLMEAMYNTAKKTTEELGKIDDFDAEEKNRLFHMIGLGALKYFILKVDPKKNMLFNPEESIDFNGNTAPFIQYTHARICSILRKADKMGESIQTMQELSTRVSAKERNLIQALYAFPIVAQQAAQEMSPAQIANYVYDLAKEFNQFYHDHSVLNEPDGALRSFRLRLCTLASRVIKDGMALLGIEVPDRM